MPRLGTFEAAVAVNGLDLPEYCVQTDHATNTVTCWIPSEAGKEFKVKCKNVEAITINSNLKLAGFLKVDGKKGGSAWLGGMKGESLCVYEVMTSATTSRNIMFSSIELTDDDAFLNAERLKDLGDITLTMQLVACTELRVHANDEIPDSDGKLHERSKKAMAHRVKFGEKKVHAPRKQMVTSPVQMLATFVFKYRSIDILRADGIAPPEPAVQKSSGTKRKASGDEVEVCEEVDDEKELKVLQAKVNELQKRIQTKEAKSKPKKKKKENRPVVIPDEILDLTL